MIQYKKAVYKTAFELDQRRVVELAGDRTIRCLSGSITKHIFKTRC